MSRTNAVVIIADSLRKDHCGCYGNLRIRTPNIDRLAARGARFTQAYPESLPTIPVRRALFTGRRVYPFRHYRPVPWDIVTLPGWQPMDPAEPTVAEALAAAGYQTGYVTDTMPVYAPGMNFERGFHQSERIRGQQNDRWRSTQDVTDEQVAEYTVSDAHTESHRKIIAQHLANTHDRTDEADWFAPRVYRSAMRFLEENAGGERPFYLVVDHFDPHEPWDPPEHYTEMYDPGYEGRARRGIHPVYGSADWLDRRQVQHMRALYAGEVTLCDTWLGKFLDRLDELGLAEDTVVVFLSDHGHLLGEHDLTGKIAWAMYPELIDIPAIWVDPETSGGQAVDGLITNIDLVATLLNRLGVTMERPADGIDLRPMLGDGGHGGRPYVTCAFRDFVFVRKGRWAMIAHFKGTQHQLFDIEDDPGCNRNVASQHRGVCDELFQLALDDAGGELPVYDQTTTFADGSQTDDDL